MTGMLDPGRGRIRFADFEVDFQAGQLRRAGERVALKEQSFSVLAALLERPGEVLTRDELRRRLWPGDVFVDFDNNLNSAVARLREALGDSAESPQLIETLPKRGYRFIGRLKAPAAAPGKIRVAVLPFANFSGDPAQEFFCDGMTEELIGQLAVLAPAQLSVLARTTSMHYKGTTEPVGRIARDLRVDYVVEGSVRRERSTVRVSAQLIEAGDESHAWAGTFDASLRHIVQLQEEVARAIAGHVLGALPQVKAAAARALDPPAHDAYLRGLYQMSRQTPAGLAAGAECFESAIGIEPGYAAAYAKLALCHVFAAYFGYVNPQAYGLAETAATRALALDAASSDAQFAVAMVRWMHTWDLRACEKALDRAIELNANDPNAHMGRAVFLATVPEDHAGAATEIAIARALDPLSMLIRTIEGWILYWGRQFDLAITHGRETIRLDENAVQAYGMLGLALIAAGAAAEALTPLRTAAERFGDPLSLAWLGLACGMAGDRTGAGAVLAQFDRWPATRYLPPACPAWVHVGLGNPERALDLLEDAYTARDAMLLILRVSPSFDALKSGSRYRRLVAKLGLPPRVRSDTKDRPPAKGFPPGYLTGF
jgi:TolB-like protein